MAGPTSIQEANADLGGTRARRGFSYQDHVAVAFLVDMLADPGLQEVWCEVVDDVTLLWDREGQKVVEFVQVKTDSPGRLWTVALLCERESKKPGTSIVERSLARATCAEPCRFRLVTVFEFAPPLDPLRLELDHPGRTPGSPPVEDVVAAVKKKLADVPEGGRDTRYWVENAVLDPRGAESVVRDACHVRLGDFLSEVFAIGFPDQVRDVHSALLSAVFNAAAANGGDKKLTRGKIESRIKARVQELKQTPTRDRLRAELQAIGLPPEMIDDIVWRRYEYGLARRRSTYATAYDALDATAAVQEAMHSLRLQYEARLLPDDPAQFHVRCLEAIRRLPEMSPALADVPVRQLEGALYDLVERGVHTFRRSSQ
jgi:hypothetical protein